MRRVSPTLEQLAFDAAQRALDKQERLLEEVRARTGVLLAAASLAASFLGTRAFEDPSPGWLTALALAGFLIAVGASVYGLTPKRGFVFALSGPRVYEDLYEFRHDVREVHRRLAYALQRFWDRNDRVMRRITRAYRIAASALVVETLALAGLASGSIL